MVIAIAPIVVTAVVPALAVAIAPAAPDVENFDGFVDAFLEKRGIAPSEDWISSSAYVRENIVGEALAAIIEEEEEKIDVLIRIPFDIVIIIITTSTN